MAELHVQPKKKSSILPWLLLLLGVAALIWYLTSRGKDEVTTTNVDATAPVTNSSTSNNAAASDWSDIDFNAPAVNYDEVTDQNINVRGNNAYGIYGLGENVLFDEAKATIRPDAEANLKQVVSSIDKRYNGGVIRIYGYTDAQGGPDYNKDLAQQRADAVQTWLIANGIDGSRISVNGIGESKPVATNETEAGRQQNRRVEIVAKAKS